MPETKPNVRTTINTVMATLVMSLLGVFVYQNNTITDDNSNLKIDNVKLRQTIEGIETLRGIDQKDYQDLKDRIRIIENTRFSRNDNKVTDNELKEWARSNFQTK